MIQKILARIQWCRVCQAMTRWKKDDDKIWYCTRCGNDQ